MIRKLLIGILWLSLQVSCYTAFSQDATVVNLKIDPSKSLGKIPNDFIGFGYETSAVAIPGYFSVKNQQLIELYRSLGSKGMIRIGGNISDHTKFVKDGQLEARPQSEVTIINQASLEELGAFIKQTGWTVMWGLNLGTGTKEEAVEEAIAVKAALGNHLHSFEIGNEVDLLPKYKGDYPGFFAAYVEYKSAIREAMPDAVFSGPDIARETEWCLKFGKSEANDLALVTQHYYRTGAKNPDATFEKLLGRHESLDAMLRSLRQLKIETNVGYRINETNSFFGGGKVGVSDTFASALWCLDYCFVLASHGCAGVNLQTDINHLAWVSHYSPIFRDESNRLTARPSYYGMLAFSLTARGELFQVESDASNFNFVAYGTQSIENGGEAWITLVNKDLTKNALVRMSLPDVNEIAHTFQLSAPTIASTEDVTLGGRKVADNGSWTLPAGEPLASNSGAIEVLVPKASACLLRVTSR